LQFCCFNPKTLNSPALPHMPVSSPLKPARRISYEDIDQNIMLHTLMIVLDCILSPSSPVLPHMPSFCPSCMLKLTQLITIGRGQLKPVPHHVRSTCSCLPCKLAFSTPVKPSAPVLPHMPSLKHLREIPLYIDIDQFAILHNRFLRSFIFN
jgi:hypothetical protein